MPAKGEAHNPRISVELGLFIGITYKSFQLKSFSVGNHRSKAAKIKDFTSS
jgi:hypothetical protein